MKIINVWMFEKTTLAMHKNNRKKIIFLHFLKNQRFYCVCVYNAIIYFCSLGYDSKIYATAPVIPQLKFHGEGNYNSIRCAPYQQF